MNKRCRASASDKGAGQPGAGTAEGSETACFVLMSPRDLGPWGVGFELLGVQEEALEISAGL